MRKEAWIRESDFSLDLLSHHHLSKIVSLLPGTSEGISSSPLGLIKPRLLDIVVGVAIK